MRIELKQAVKMGKKGKKRHLEPAGLEQQPQQQNQSRNINDGSTAEDQQMSKKKRKKLINVIKSGKGTPQQYLDIYGENACVELELKLPKLTQLDNHQLSQSRYITVPDVRDLVLWTLAGSSQNGIGVSPQWIFVSYRLSFH